MNNTIQHINKNIQLICIDLFCGAGGVTTGIEQARDKEGNKIAKVIACVNHDAKAIESHKANHPDTLHFIEDIRTLNLDKLIQHTNLSKQQYPNAKLLLWASLECTHFSNAKGGQPRDADSRSLANDFIRYIEALNPDIIGIENVREFMSWGPLNEKGKPISKNKGRYYMRWIKQINTLGYQYDWKILNAADYGAYTSRKRYFGIFAKPSLKISFPKATHSKNPVHDVFGTLHKWKAVKEVLDFEDEGRSILNRKKSLSERTLQRIYAGLEKFIAKGKTPKAFLSKYYSGNPSSKNISIEEPAHTITAVDHHSMISPSWLVKFLSNNPRTGINRGVSIDIPAPTLTCQNRIALAQCNFLSTYYKNGSNYTINSPAPTVTTKDRIAKIHYLMNPQFNSSGASIDKPCFTLIASMDKRPPYLVTTKTGQLAIQIEETDSDMMQKIKVFMALYGIYDIKMRMLKVSELKQITGFSNNYILKGNQAQQKKFIGNAVVVPMARKLVECLVKNNNK